MMTIHIDNHTIQCQEGESILDVARKNGIFIPAICYLNGCSPTVACRLCMVEVDGKRVYSCNAKVKDGMNIQTNTPDIAIERQAIMRVYDINHPLECGVCNKSGECELQNYSHMMRVDHQEYAIRDTFKQKSSFGHALYDPNLCIVCERCVTVCEDRIGDSNLSTTKRGADMPDKIYKDTMPKDAFGTWTKLSKSLITNNGKDCGDCGECIAVCPVGALTEEHFHYTSNAWELTKIESHCPHCPLGCSLRYEGKQGKLYRVKNAWIYSSLCGAGRYGWDVDFGEPKGELSATIEAFNKAETISFGNFITNEEAFILQALKEQKGYRLYNPTAREFQSFLQTFMASGIAGDTQILKQSSAILSIGCNVAHDVPVLRHLIHNTLKMRKGSSFFALHPLGDKFLDNKSAQYLTYSAGEEYAALLWLARFIKGELPAESAAEPAPDSAAESGEKTDAKKDDKKTISSPFGELEQKTLEPLRGEQLTIIAGSDLYHHPQSKYIAKLLALLSQSANVILLPPEGNALGVALICDLDNQLEGYTIGFNKSGHYRLSSLPQDDTTDCTMPSLLQQYGSLTTLDRRVVPLLPAYTYNGITLADIAFALGNPAAFLYKDTKRPLDEYTQLLPKEQGYAGMSLRELFAQKSALLAQKGDKESPMPLSDFPAPHDVSAIPQDCLLVYGCDPQSQFSPWSYASKLLRAKGGLYVSKDFLQKWNLTAGEVVHLQGDSGQYSATVFVDDKLCGESAMLSLGQFMRDEHPLFKPASRFAVVRIIPKLGENND